MCTSGIKIDIKKKYNHTTLTIAINGQDDSNPPLPVMGSKNGTTQARRQADNGA
jgi:hypothetical protein